VRLTLLNKGLRACFKSPISRRFSLRDPPKSPFLRGTLKGSVPFIKEG